MISSSFDEDKVEFSQEDDEAFTDIVELIHYLENLGEFYYYIDDMKILVIDGSREPLIIVSPEKFMELERKVLGLN